MPNLDTTKMSSKGQVVIPESIRKHLGLKAGAQFVVVGEKRSIGRHPVRVFELPSELVEKGRAEYLENLESAREYDDFGVGLEIEELYIPSYLVK